jgi:hypothetical protein
LADFKNYIKKIVEIMKRETGSLVECYGIIVLTTYPIIKE